MQSKDQLTKSTVVDTDTGKPKDSDVRTRWVLRWGVWAPGKPPPLRRKVPRVPGRALG